MTLHSWKFFVLDVPNEEKKKKYHFTCTHSRKDVDKWSLRSNSGIQEVLRTCIGEEINGPGKGNEKNDFDATHTYARDLRSSNT